MTKTILTIAGSDTLGGGGLQTDLKTFENHHVFGVTAITCLATADTAGFTIHDLPIALLNEQLATIAQTMDVAGIKIGLIHQTEAIPVVETFIKNFTGPIVLDPVLAFKETTEVYHQNYKQALIRLFPYAMIITPNLKEAELLTEMKIETVADMKLAAKKLVDELGAKAVVIKGGERMSGERAYDLFYDKQNEVLLEKTKLNVPTINGAGCSFASAIAANLVQEKTLLSAITAAKEFVFQSIKQGILLENGEGNVWFGQNSEEVANENT
ncbi:bifunctional hydroxymethylpyrimidine kinase/phosphomethylpyrimidine kinase [Enterococcus sp. JM4C]|uniref:bifunctional hydroxymethylpyrimidine kinase/phosphomethylpyrimidine kinase n=1 Tax=Candidatus Enterococcus huntleyi TaxID=1857217 RepID=UPI00137B220A|nr:bifunctional hydroxymethylpyrimidine kinase/phosphomethylpyrimidine kinase [Enterococcus sp. JM4C]KAF1296748.1 bifunctional hydroxymethylpyrimidine kinase/phosphomethylpyrimidine kinase [Enterococcus sp. JM4C]